MNKAKLKEFNKTPDEFKEIVIFSEGKSYWSTFAPVIKSLISRGQSLSYITMDSNDPGLSLESGLIRSYFVGTGFNSMLFMNMIEADLVLMTTPGLGSLNIKRSPGVKNYVHIVHSPADMAYYRKFSFDHFDTVMCSGEHQINTLRRLEEIRKSNHKSLLKTGCVYFDSLEEMKSGNSDFEKKTEKTVLLAPTWGTIGALSKYGSALITPLLDAGLNVIVRPHPQQYKSEAALLKKLQKQLSSYDNIEWDDRTSGHESLCRADVMISDLSGVIFDFAFAYQKPVISLDYTLDNKTYEADDLDYKAWEINIREELGALFNADSDSSILDIVNNLLNEKNREDKLNDLRNNSLFNYGKAGETAATQLIKLLEGIKGKS